MTAGMFPVLEADLVAKASGRPAGYLEAVRAAATEIRGGVLWFEPDVYAALVAKYNQQAGQPTGSGVGSQLKRTLYSLGIRPAANCQCNKRAAEMDARGVAWCEQNEDIIVGWLREEAARAHLPFSAMAARLLVRSSIRLARNAQSE
jgi:hypothetical protein